MEIEATEIEVWNRKQVVDVTKAHHKKNKSREIWQRDFKCDKFGRTQSNWGLTDEDRVRTQRTTGKFGCRMKIRLEALEPNNTGGQWK
ncbi:hypothetical protein L917_08704 [Phytophthora nicotianae]|uniref:FAR1 domain-containing protein n=1 Tax=Phytophthora nicotianae TaxID=4792 RepID=W2L6R1_PHYNI|nr:hypothetical protein L917_08704 [Phytophthora nicotianae]